MKMQTIMATLLAVAMLISLVGCATKPHSAEDPTPAESTTIGAGDTTEVEGAENTATGAGDTTETEGTENTTTGVVDPTKAEDAENTTTQKGTTTTAKGAENTTTQKGATTTVKGAENTTTQKGATTTTVKGAENTTTQKGSTTTVKATGNTTTQKGATTTAKAPGNTTTQKGATTTTAKVPENPNPGKPNALLMLTQEQYRGQGKLYRDVTGGKPNYSLKLTAMADLKQVRVITLNADTSKPDTVLYTALTFKKGESLYIQTYVNDTAPTRGIFCIDEKGRVHCYAIVYSGKDGSVSLKEISAR